MVVLEPAAQEIAPALENAVRHPNLLTPKRFGRSCNTNGWWWRTNGQICRLVLCSSARTIATTARKPGRILITVK